MLLPFPLKGNLLLAFHAAVLSIRCRWHKWLPNDAIFFTLLHFEGMEYEETGISVVP